MILDPNCAYSYWLWQQDIEMYEVTMGAITDCCCFWMEFSCILANSGSAIEVHLELLCNSLAGLFLTRKVTVNCGITFARCNVV